jgi:two-component system response regulator NreC
LITETTTTIYLADDHELVATGIASIICNCLPNAKVTTFKNGQLLFQAAEKEVPDLVFLDYEMPIWDGKTTLIELKKKLPELPVLMLSMLNEKAIIQSCITHGAIGFLNKDCSLDEFKMAIESALSGIVFYSREVLKSLSGTASNSVNIDAHIEELTERELDVLRLLCEGMSPKEIGEKLFLSPRTVEKHKDNIMQKMEVSSVAKLISVALKNKLI